MFHITKEYLVNEYVNQEKSSNIISNEIGCAPNTIRNHLKRYGIDIRNISTANNLATGHSIKLSEELKSILYGLLLGDGNLRSFNKFSATYRHTDKNKDYIYWLKNLFKRYDLNCSNPYHYEYIRDGKDREHYQLESLAYRELIHIYNKFYNHGKKIIPDDLVIDRNVLLHHYMGDGTFHKKSKILNLYTLGFLGKDVRKLSDKYSKFSNCEFRVYHSHRYNDGRGYYLNVSRNDLDNFFKSIGLCPISCYNYKWM